MPASKRLACVDGLRGVAILLVMSLHLRGMAEGCASQARLRILFEPGRVGGSGIELFLVLSGFSLTHSLIRKTRSGHPPDALQYVFDRCRRIAYPYYVALALYLITIAIQQAVHHQVLALEGGLYRQIIVHVLFVHGFWQDTIYAISAPLWFLSMLFQIYLVFRLLVRFAEKVGYPLFVLAIIAISMAWHVFVIYGLRSHFYLVNGVFLGLLAPFAMGMWVAAWYNRPDRRAASRVMCAVCLLSALVLLTGAAALRGPYRLLVDFFLGAGFSALLMAALASDEYHGLFGRACAIGPLVWTGKISYSLYLTHGLVAYWTGPLYHRLLLPHTANTDDFFLVATLISIFGLGWFFYRVVESPLSHPRSAREPSEHSENSLPEDRALGQPIDASKES
jgi:peptidoglycan/LPS O-acetylase OafA/YrhL